MKTCIDCDQVLELSQFVPKPSNKGGYEHRCRKCRSIKYNKSTPDLLCKKLYLSQITHSVTREHDMPAYSLTELTTWVKAQPLFTTMYLDWRHANYAKDLAPSIDRLNDALPYTLDNIQLLTWAANRAKGAQAKRNSTLLVNHRAVAAYNLDGSLYKEYLSMSDAMRDLGGIGMQSWGISTVCNGIAVKDGRGALYMPKTYKGFIWKWIN